MSNQKITKQEEKDIDRYIELIIITAKKIEDQFSDYAPINYLDRVTLAQKIVKDIFGKK